VVTGIVLESPVLSWAEALLHQGDALDLPGPVKRGALTLVSSRWGARLTGHDEPIDVRSLELVARVEDLAVPVLVLHSEDDGFAPIESSRRLARERPDLVQLVPFSIARHTKLWNHDPERWEGAIAAWLRGDEEGLRALGATVPAGSDRPQRRRRFQRA
jgi:pimeloyl-ACP methyl ester carboxylesterase